MKKGNVLLLAAGYLAGLAVALRFNKKSPSELAAEMGNSDEKYKTFAQNVVEIHKSLFESVETAIFCEENKKRVEEYKAKFLTELEGFQKDVETKMEEWKKLSLEKRDEAEAQLRDLYNRRVELMEQAKSRGIELVDEVEKEGKDLLEEGKKVADKVFDEARKNLDKTYAEIKDRLSKK